MKLHLEQLGERALPANLIPGWDGPEEHDLGRFDGDAIYDTAAVATAGGSCHVVIVSGRDGSILFNEILYDVRLRGGGSLSVIRGESMDRLLVVPGVGGGPVVTAISFDGGVQSHTFFAPYDRDFRGGLRVSSGDIDGDGQYEAFFLPGEGGGPRLVAVDMATFETELSIWVGNAEDLSGETRFEPTGGVIPLGSFGPGLLVQYGETVDWSAPSRIFDLAGVDRTDDFIHGRGWL